MELNEVVNFKGSNQIFLHYIYLIWTIIITYDIITLTKVVKTLKFSEKNPHAVYSNFITCSWRENILSSFVHSLLQFPSKSNFCTKILENAPSFVAVWQKKVILNISARQVMTYITSATPHTSKSISASYKQLRAVVNIQQIDARTGKP
jgi:hypothetical protein